MSICASDAESRYGWKRNEINDMLTHFYCGFWRAEPFLSHSSCASDSPSRYGQRRNEIQSQTLLTCKPLSIVAFDVQNPFYRTHPALVTHNHDMDKEGMRYNHRLFGLANPFLFWFLTCRTLSIDYHQMTWNLDMDQEGMGYSPLHWEFHFRNLESRSVI